MNDIRGLLNTDKEDAASPRNQEKYEVCQVAGTVVAMTRSNVWLFGCLVTVYLIKFGFRGHRH